MELSVRQVAFVKSQMREIEEDDSRQPTEKVEARRIREVAENTLTE